MKTIEVIDLAETLYVVIRIVCNFDQDWYKTLVAGGQTDGSHPVIQKAHRDHCVQKCVNFFKATKFVCVYSLTKNGFWPSPGGTLLVQVPVLKHGVRAQ